MQCCPALLEPGLGVEEAQELAALFRVIADPARLRLLNLIASAGEACACEFVDGVGLSQPTVSHHLKVLSEAGILEREKRGRWVYYRPSPTRLASLAASLSQDHASATSSSIDSSK